MQGRKFGIYRMGQTVHALEDVCPHADALLSQGFEAVTLPDRNDLMQRRKRPEPSANVAQRMDLRQLDAHTPVHLVPRVDVHVLDGGLMLNLGELACAVQDNAKILRVANENSAGVMKNAQDDLYGGRPAYVDLDTPDFAQGLSRHG